MGLGPLLFFAALQWLVFARGWQTIAWFADPMMNTVSRLLGRSLLFTYFLRTGSTFLPFMALWYIATFACLQMFFVSNRRYRARWQQLLRIYVHASAFAALAPALWCVLEVMLDSSLFVFPNLRSVLNVWGLQNPYVLLGRAVFILTAAVTWCHLWIGYHCFLRYPRGWGVAALCLMLGYLIAELAIMLLYWG